MRYITGVGVVVGVVIHLAVMYCVGSTVCGVSAAVHDLLHHHRVSLGHLFNICPGGETWLQQTGEGRFMRVCGFTS